MLRALGMLLFLELTPATALAQPCSPTPLKEAVTALDAARADLQALPFGDGMETNESPHAQSAITAMKARLGQFVSAYMACAPASVSPKAAQAGLTRLARAPKDQKEGSLPERFGSELNFAVRAQPNGLLGVTAEFDLECGVDTVLMIFAPDAGTWREVLRAQAPPYKSVADAWADFNYAVSPRDTDGNWFVVVSTVAPWCSSNWSDIRYAVYRPSSDPLKPHRLYNASASFFRNDDIGTLVVGRDGFDLRFPGESIDDAVFSRQWVRHFSVVGDAVRRIPPLAVSQRDFAEEWIQSPWADAQPWTRAAGLKDIHDKLHAKPFADFVSVRRCPAGARQIEIEPGELEGHYFLEVSGPENFTMLRVSIAPDMRCGGKSLYDPDKPGPG